ncbi:MAG: rRNA maturation RNase YbeY [Alphaproteobacteria bacterium]|nr:rRNA maturation RNase YbeY [Alphaproteobacteria bacterium]
MTKPQTKPNVEICISIQSHLWDDVNLGIIGDCVEHSLQTALKEVNKTPESVEEISIVLANDEFIQELNHTYRGKDAPTNVLSFPQTEPEEFEYLEFIDSLGDIILSYETIMKESTEQNKTFEKHLKHLLVHGVLHVLHFDHENEEDAQKMESLEIQILKQMGIKNPYEII